MRFSIIFTFLNAQFLICVHTQEMLDLYCGDKNCYEGKKYFNRLRFMKFCMYVWMNYAYQLLNTKVRNF